MTRIAGRLRKLEGNEPGRNAVDLVLVRFFAPSKEKPVQTGSLAKFPGGMLPDLNQPSDMTIKEFESYAGGIVERVERIEALPVPEQDKQLEEIRNEIITINETITTRSA